jgi:hypothetical protein
MSEQNVLNERTEKVDVGLPFTPELNEAYDTNPIFRVMLDVSYSRTMGLLQKGFYVKLNDSVYYIAKQTVEVMTNTQTEKVLEFLKKTQTEFTIDIYNDKTISGHQYIQVHDVDFNSGLYTLRDFKVFKSIWQEIEGELYENKYSPSIARFTSDRLIWYAQLLPEHSLQFTQVATISLSFVDNQGHLQIFKIVKEGEFEFPSYLYSFRKSFRFFNHEINQAIDVIPLGSERRIISISKDMQITSSNHEPITLPQGQYLLFHPRPRDAVD